MPVYASLVDVDRYGPLLYVVHEATGCRSSHSEHDLQGVQQLLDTRELSVDPSHVTA